MNVNFYQFQKRENSTAQPGIGVTATTYVCKLKDNCSIINPVIQIAKESAQAWSLLIGFNYAYIPDFNRYYFVRDIVMESNVICSITLEVDALASWKSQIGSASEYVLRSASSYDGDIIDTLYPAKAVCTLVEGTSVGVFNTAQITFIIGVINNEQSNKAGAVQYYAMDATQMYDFMQFLLGSNSAIQMDTFLGTISNLNQAIQDSVARSMMNPASYIVESYALPYTPDTASLATVKVGWWELANAATVIRPRTNHIDIGSGTYTLQLPRHPQAATRGNYLNSAPFTRYSLNLGPFGVYALDATKLAGQTSVNVSVFGDNFGNVTCNIEAGGVVIDRLTACVKCPFAVGQVNIDALGAMASGVAIASDLQSNIKEPEGEKSFNFGNIMSAVNALMPQVSRQGSQGNFSNVFPDFKSIAEHYTVVDDDLAQRGRPLCQKVQISSLSGYILVSDPDIAITGTAEENEKIKAYMASGFYYE